MISIHQLILSSFLLALYLFKLQLSKKFKIKIGVSADILWCPLFLFSFLRWIESAPEMFRKVSFQKLIFYILLKDCTHERKTLWTILIYQQSNQIKKQRQIILIKIIKTRIVLYSNTSFIVAVIKYHEMHLLVFPILNAQH